MSQTDFSDETLMAFADGELDPATAEAIALRRAADPALAERIRVFEDSARLARQAFDHIAQEPVPLRLLAATRPAGPSWRQPRASRPLMALAASVVLAVGLGAGYLVARLHSVEAPGGLAGFVSCSGVGLSAALETAGSGQRRTEGDCTIVPVASYRIDSGAVCRAFQAFAGADAGRSAIAGMACRGDGGDWSTRVAIDLTAGPGASGGYAPASGPAGGLAALQAALGLKAAPLSAADEERLLRSGWRDTR